MQRLPNDEQPRSLDVRPVDSALPEQHPSQPSLGLITNDLPSQLPFDAYQSRNRAAGADSLPPKGRLDGGQSQSSPKGLM